MYRHFFKRFFDFWIALIGLIAISPILLIVSVWLHFANKGAGAFFFQKRLGKDAKPFNVIKFKTMTDERDKDGVLLPDAKRITPVGRFVRSTSLDEIPQLINILKGDMSLIGPRPLTIGYLNLYNEYQARRMEMKPGISGWAQVHGRNHLKLSKKFEMDVWYVDHCSLCLDVRIILLTILNVLKRTDVGDGSSDWSDMDDVGFAEKMKNLKERGLWK